MTSETVRGRVAIVVVARMSSTRLPGKSLRILGGDTVLGHVLSRASMSREADCIIVATSSHSTDDPISDWCRDREVRCFRGSLADVALRVLGAAEASGAAGIVRVSADSPFIDPALIDHAIRLFRDQSADLVTNVFPRTFPKGESVEVIAVNALERLLLNGLTLDQQEHVTKAFYDAPERHTIIGFSTADAGGPTVGDHSHVQLAIDTDADWATAVAVSDLLGETLDSASWLEIEQAWTQVAEGAS